ncbi:Guanine nucleotide exchange factor for Cdc42p [Ophidiomyces ophidiicola]|nr:Guanine nucleotide exchange factor for Cdc42p [Ophidiomyces ophidiicola]
MEPTLSQGHVMAEDNIINRRGGESLYQSCANLKKRLAEVPGFESHLAEMEALDKTQEVSDPVASVWRCLQNGYPLMTIFNATQPSEPLTLDESKVQEHRRPKAAAFKFLQACLQDLEFPQQECFLITDLYGESTTGFVIKMVNRVLDILEMHGQLYKPSISDSNPVERKTKLTRREHILKEMLETERDYVHHLQNLQALKKELEETGALNGDTSHQIFLNLNNLLDFAQRFLIRMEQHNALAEESQNWGELFINHQEGFRQYEPFIANQLRCDVVCQREWDKIHTAPRSPDLQQMVAQLSTLNGFFVKPFQRLTKYPLMLQELKKQTERADFTADIATAIDIIQSVLDRANNAIDKEHLVAATQDVAARVDDWKSLRVESFGQLLRFGTFTVVKGDGGKDNEKEYHVYLFEQMLLCCKDILSNKPKSKLMGKDKPNASAQKGKPRMVLKGRIYISNVTEILYFHRPGSYRVQIFWKGDPGVVDNLSIRFRDEETMRKWYKDINHQRTIQVKERIASRSGPSEIEFTYLKNAKMENPYAEEYNAEEDLAPGVSDFAMSRNASSTSLRARSGTGGSGGSNPPIIRPPRFPMPEPPLSLQTQFSPGALSPGERHGGSYFSPMTEVAPSTRSSSSTTFTYSRQGTPSNQWNEESNRYTAPAMPRAGSRDGPTSSPYYSNPPRGTQRPSLPPFSSQNSQHPAQSRMRSASSPDIHNHNLSESARRYMNGHTMQTVDNVPVPPIPANLANMRAPVNRSQNNSPGTLQPPHSLRPGLPSGPNEPSYMISRDTSRSQPSLSSHAPPSRDSDSPLPAQLKAKVNFNDNYVTLVIASNILYRSLTDRVDAKLSRFTDRSIGAKSARLRYRDEDGDFVTIDSDEAVQLAIMEWREQHQNTLSNGQVGEIQLFCQPVEH